MCTESGYRKWSGWVFNGIVKELHKLFQSNWKSDQKEQFCTKQWIQSGYICPCKPGLWHVSTLLQSLQMFNIFFSHCVIPSWSFHFAVFLPDWRVEAFTFTPDILLLALPAHLQEIKGATAKNYTDDIWTSQMPFLLRLERLSRFGVCSVCCEVAQWGEPLHNMGA